MVGTIFLCEKYTTFWWALLSFSGQLVSVTYFFYNSSYMFLLNRKCWTILCRLISPDIYLLENLVNAKTTAWWRWLTNSYFVWHPLTWTESTFILISFPWNLNFNSFNALNVKQMSKTTNRCVSIQSQI